MKKVFLSYSYSDQEAQMFARFLNEHLPSLGAEPLELYNEICMGEDLHHAITEQINKCSLFICFLQPSNSNVMFELGYALGKNKKIIVVGDLHDLPSDVRSMIYLSRDSSHYDILDHIEKFLASYTEREPFWGLDPSHPRDSIATLIERPELLDNIDGREFEELVGQWFREKGYEVENEFYRGDRGYDFLVEPFKNNKAVVEVKKYKSTSQVPVSVIRQLVGTMSLVQVPVGIVVSSAPFTKSAKYFVENIEPTILLWTLEDLAAMNNMPNKTLEWTR
jgi:hypothetical protein